MQNSTHHSQAYLKFLNLVKAIRDLPTFPTLDAVEQTVMPTPLANQFFDQIGQCMDAARQA